MHLFLGGREFGKVERSHPPWSWEPDHDRAPTPAQIAGPFFPGDNILLENDLTRLARHPERAAGVVVYVQGVVRGRGGQPLAGAKVLFWQACASGRYNHPLDRNPAALDPDFRYWGGQLTNSQGGYFFKTIRPGAYPDEPGWVRPPHIHFKVSCPGHRDLVTQLYFRADLLNESDHILLELPPAERELLLVDFRPAPAPLESGSLLGRFDISLSPAPHSFR